MSDKLLPPDVNLADFRAWLERQPADGQVGVARSKSCCPLACYLAEVRDGANPTVTHDRYRLSFTYRGGPTLPWRRLPAWAKRFTRLVDHRLHSFEGVERGEALAQLAYATRKRGSTP